MNLYETVIKCLNENKHTFEDVIWIGNLQFSIPIENFVTLSKQLSDNGRFDYDHLSKDIKIVGKDFWLEINPFIEYYPYLDPFEPLSDINLWVYKTQPAQPSIEKCVNALSLDQASEYQKRKSEKYMALMTVILCESFFCTSLNENVAQTLTRIFVKSVYYTLHQLN